MSEDCYITICERGARPRWSITMGKGGLLHSSLPYVTLLKKTPLDSLWKLFEGTEMAKHDGHLSHFTFLLFLMGEGTVQKIEGGMS